MLALDTGFAIYNNAFSKAGGERWDRETDPHSWQGEVAPRLFYPTSANFQIHKPGQRSSSQVYGGFYSKSLLSSPTIVGQVLELRKIGYSIDENGFRDTTPIGAARFFALGDSFTAGMGVDQQDNWTELLEPLVGEPVYNLGWNSSSPRQHLLLLRYLLQSGKIPQIQHLLWTIFEGNDLEDDYRPVAPTELYKNSIRRRFEDTFLFSIAQLPENCRRRSVLRQLWQGDFTFSSSIQGKSPYNFEGVALSMPLYHSKKYGRRFFEPDYLERATKPESYIETHPNLPDFKESIFDAKELAQNHGFQLTIIIAPSAERLYAPYFDHVPQVSAEPHFVRFVEGYSRELGLNVINLYPVLSEQASKDLIYLRDDSHWNELGHEIVARVIARAIQIRGGS